MWTGGESKRITSALEQFGIEGTDAVLCNPMMLSEGVDVTNMQCVAIMCTMSSPRMVEQILGRTVRKDPMDPNKVGYMLLPTT